MIEKKSAITKVMLRSQLQQGHTLNDLLAFGPGQDCEIFKADKFYPGDVVIYVPDVSLNHIPLDCPITGQEELEEVLSQCYTGQDFIDECCGDVEKAEHLFGYCNWQHPSSAIDELADAAELSDTEPEYFGLDMDQYRDAAGENADKPHGSIQYRRRLQSRPSVGCTGNGCVRFRIGVPLGPTSTGL